MKLQVLLVLLLSGFTTVAFAAEADDAAEPEVEEEKTVEGPPTAVGDRPTFSVVAATVPAGHAQLEVGAEFSTSEDESQLAFPVLVRVGIAEMFELRAGLPSLIVPLSDDSAEVGTIQLGAKVAGDVTDSLSLGAMPYFDIAASSGDDDAWSQSSYGFLLLWGFGLTDSFGLAGTLGAAVGPGTTEEAGPRELFTSASLAASYSTGAIGVTAEGFTIIGQFADTTVGGGLSLGYSIFDHLVVDVYGGSSAQGDALNVFAGAGVTLAR